MFPLLLFACTPKPEPADVVLDRGTIYTLDATNTAVGALAVRDGAIVYAGDDVFPFVGPDTRQVHLGGRVVLPGFHDAHTHLLWSGADLLMVDLYAAQTIAEFQSTVAAWASEHPEEAWVQGGGWDTSVFYGHIDRSTLDAVVSDRPAYVYSADAHIGLANSLALAQAGITASTPNPEDGTIQHGTDGEPNGILLEGAMSLVDTLIPPYADATVDEGLRNAQAEANGYGITSVVDANTAEWMLEGYTRADAVGALHVRVHGAVEVDPADTNAVARLQNLRTEYASPHLEVSAAKFYLDGIIESQTAVMLAPYVDGTNGTPVFTDTQLRSLATEIDAAGFQLHAHAIGDGAVRQFLDAIAVVIETNGVRDRRPLGAHLEVVDPADWPRFAELDVLADFQPLWAYPDSYIQQLTWPVIGEDRSQYLYPIGSVVAAGGSFVGGSDWSVSSQNPLEAIEVAVTRMDPWAHDGPALTPENAVDVLTAVRAYTSEGARASFSEESSGTLEVGKRADLVVLDADPFTVDAADISTIHIHQTWLDGELVYENPGPGGATAKSAGRRTHEDGR